jgi:hypothetical protein
MAAAILLLHTRDVGYGRGWKQHIGIAMGAGSACLTQSKQQPHKKMQTIATMQCACMMYGRDNDLPKCVVEKDMQWRHTKDALLIGQRACHSAENHGRPKACDE